MLISGKNNKLQAVNGKHFQDLAQFRHYRFIDSSSSMYFKSELPQIALALKTFSAISGTNGQEVILNHRIE